MGEGRTGIALLTVASASIWASIAYHLPKQVLAAIGLSLFVIALGLLYRGVPESEYRKGVGLKS